MPHTTRAASADTLVLNTMPTFGVQDSSLTLPKPSMQVAGRCLATVTLPGPFPKHI